MNTCLWNLKTDPESLPFPFPGRVSYLDFTEERFQTSDSRIFIRPVLYLEAEIPAEPDSCPFPCRKDSCVLLYIREGQAQLESSGKAGKTENTENAGKSFVLTEGCGLLTSADGSLRLKHDRGPLSCMLFLLTGELLWELYRVQKEQVLLFSRYDFPDFEQRLDFLMSEYLQAEAPLLFGFSRHMDHLLSRIIHQSLRSEYGTTGKQNQTLMNALTYMKEHCCEQLQVGEIAAAFGYSGSHFSRIFQAHFGESPKKYLLRLRAAHAERLLVNSDLSIERVGQECGFGTTTRFIQTFREIHGMTPLQFRKQSEQESSQLPSASPQSETEAV